MSSPSSLPEPGGEAPRERPGSTENATSESVTPESSTPESGPNAAGRSSRAVLLEASSDEVDRILESMLSELGAPRYRRGQIRRWLYERTPASFDGMRDLPVALREALDARFTLHPIRARSDRVSVDGTQKFLWDHRLSRDTSDEGPGAGVGPIESVAIPDGDRMTYCISTQAGCPVRCTFCATGYGGYAGNLTAGEIVDQVVQMRTRTTAPPTNIVYMGMGEPLLNLEAVLRSLEILTHPEQIGLGARRITVSTVGVPHAIRELGRRFPGVKLAFSLHAPRDDLRTKIIPLNRKYSLAEVLEAVREHSRETRRKATFEYVVLPGVNDAPHDAEDLARLVGDIPSRINLLGFNPFREAPYEKPTVRSLLAFRDAIAARFPGDVTIRRSRGEDIHGACGQLSLVSRDEPAAR